MKKLVFFINGSHFSGAEKRLLMTAIKLAATQTHPPVIYISETLYSHIVASQKFSEAELAAVRFDVAAVPNWLRSAPRAQTLMHWLRRRKLLAEVRHSATPSDYIVHFALYNALDMQLAKQLKALGVTSVAEVTSPDIAVSANTGKLINSSSYCDALICVSENVLRLCKTQVLAAESPTGRSLEHAQRPKLLMRHLPFVDEIDTVPGFAQKQRQVIFSHRLIARKNPLLAVDAFARVARALPDWHFQVCGRGDLEEKVNFAITQAQCANLEFAGFVADVQNRINASQVFVSIIEPDNYPSQSVLEAMARGCALVVSNTGQSVDKFTDLDASSVAADGFRLATNGVVIDTLSTDAMEHALLALLQSNHLEHMAAASKQLFDTRYSQQRYLEESLALYQAV